MLSGWRVSLSQFVACAFHVLVALVMKCIYHHLMSDIVLFNCSSMEEIYDVLANRLFETMAAVEPSAK